MAGALGHQPQCYLNPQHLSLHNGRQVLRKSRGDGMSYIQAGNIREEELTEILQPKGEDLH